MRVKANVKVFNYAMKVFNYAKGVGSTLPSLCIQNTFSCWNDIQPRKSMNNKCIAQHGIYIQYN